MCEYLILISCGWLRKFSIHYRGKYLKKKKFKISGWLLISIHVREKSEMESGRVDGGGGGEECTKPWTYTLRHISWDIFPEQHLLCSFTPPPSPLPKLWKKFCVYTILQTNTERGREGCISVPTNMPKGVVPSFFFS